jgi:hypothetical protein
MMFLTITINGTDHYVTVPPGWEGTDHFWAPHLVKTPNFSLAVQNRGGYLRPDINGMTFASELFASDWPPPRTCAIAVSAGADDDGAITCFTGLVVLRGYNAETVTYEVWQDEETTMLLTNGTDENGVEAPVPMLLGSVGHFLPQRTQDRSGYQTFYKSGVAGTLHSNWKVYDDGVQLTTNVTDNGDGTFSLLVLPVGQVSVTGASSYNSLDDLFNWAASRLGTSASLNTTDPTLNVLLRNQMPLLDALDSIAWWANHVFSYGSGITVVHRNLDNGSRTLTRFFPPEYSHEPPVKQVLASYETLTPGTQANSSGTVYRLIPETIKMAADGEMAIGSVIEAPCYNNNRSAALIVLGNIASNIAKVRVSVGVPMAELATIPAVGEKITLVDSRLPDESTVVFRVRGLEYNFGDKSNPAMVTITGEGTVTA